MAQRTLRFKNGDFYKGEVNRHMLAHGSGVMNYNNGSVYEGDFKNGIRFGAGKFTGADGVVYVGCFRNDIPEGFGRVSYPDGSSYEGEWRYGGISGKGIFTEPDGSSYEGYFKEGIKDGRGVYTTADGKRIEQTYVGGQLSYEDGGGLPVLTITDDCRKSGYFHHIVCRFVAKVGTFCYRDMQILEYDPWDCTEVFDHTFRITGVSDDSVSFIYKRHLTHDDEREERVYRGKDGAFENTEVRLGGMELSEFEDQEESIEVMCE
ncbi:MAG: hypothetical protein IJ696_03170 [Ruminococcus sp.]|nr:hypothetical protein [Ruminococcus sp.]